MQSRHYEIKAEEDMGVRIRESVGMPKPARQSAMLEFCRILDAFHHEESRGQKDAESQIHPDLALLSALGGENRETHGQSAGQEEKGVHGAELPVQMLGAFMEGGWMQGHENDEA